MMPERIPAEQFYFYTGNLTPYSLPYYAYEVGQAFRRLIVAAGLESLLDGTLVEKAARAFSHGLLGLANPDPAEQVD
jgi:hypothetical protein